MYRISELGTAKVYSKRELYVNAVLSVFLHDCPIFKKEGGQNFMLLDRIKIAAERRGLTLAEVSRRVGLGEKTMYRWDKNSPQIDHVTDVAELLNVSIDWLVGRVDESDEYYTDEQTMIAIEDIINSSHPLSYGDVEMVDDDRAALRGMLRNYFLRDPRGQARVKEYIKRNLNVTND